MLKFISESRSLFVCTVIFLTSIFLRSTVDIGADTGVYLDLGKKIAEGKKYYFDFFESNFPLSFYYYALQFNISQISGLNTIILSEIFINFLAVVSIFWSEKILRNGKVFADKFHHDLVVIAYCLGFFLRPNALQTGEFGTKTSLLLISLYPYISYSFFRKIPLTKTDLIWRGMLMGIIPCIKPHYLIFIIFVEVYRFFCKPLFKFFLELDKLVMVLIGASYLFLMSKFTPEFFEFMVPMWSKAYSSYNDAGVFMENIWRHFASRILPFSFIFLIFSRLKFSDNDKILLLLFTAASCLMLVENVGTVDQVVVFYAIITICFLKLLRDIFVSKIIIFSEEMFIITALLLIPAFDMTILPASIFGLGGLVNVWWLVALIYPFFSGKRIVLFWIPCLAILATIAVLTLKYLGPWAYITVNLTILFGALFVFEKEFFVEKLSTLSVFVIFTSISCLLYSYLSTFAGVFSRESEYTSPHKLSDMTAYYAKKYAPQKDDGIVTISIWIAHQFPLLNYLAKENIQKFHVATMRADQGVAGKSLMFLINDSDKVFTNFYLFDDIKNAVKNVQTKLVLVNNAPKILNEHHRCFIGTLEYYFLDPEFRKFFLKNFHFENRVVINHQVKPLKKISFITKEKPSVFDQIIPSKQQLLHDFEIYVRN